MQASAAVIAMPKSNRIAWVPVHSCLSVSEIADHQAKLGVAETQPDNALEQATRSAPIRRPNPPHPYPHEQLKEMYTSLPDDHMEKSFLKSERTDLARFRSGHYHAQRRSQQLLDISVAAVYRLCGEDVESSEHLWLRCPALLVERHHIAHGHAMDEHVRLSRVALALLRIMLRRLR